MFEFCPLILAMDLAKPGMDGQRAIKLELGPLKPGMDLFTFEFCPLRLTIGLTRRGMDEQWALKLELGSLRHDMAPSHMSSAS